ncbi:HARBI1 [Branchiostoma lanceolatum]|uniref:HARBI1 protein n=1 Tax=Branchiostoma lanceolatum TaxID=7740 RepID=A0A8J9ZG75_BRALA|nr:HARBI1 [Branchiostoma lanceolatum]
MQRLPADNLGLARLRLRVATARHRHNLVLAALAAEEERQAEQLRRRRRWWTRPWLLERPIYGQYERLMGELRRGHRLDFKSFLRIEPDLFDELLQRVGPSIQKSTNARQPLPIGLKLAITLRFLATGNSYRSLAFAFRVAHNTISLFVPEVCRAITAEYRQEAFDTPSTPDQWRQVAKDFQTRWNFPHVCGAIDGKHVAIKKPRKSGSLYYNYKGFFSLVILAVVDSNYKILWADVGAPGSDSDCGIFNRSNLQLSLSEGIIGFPDPEPIPNDDEDTGYFLIGDDAFPLRTFLLKPYSKRYLEVEERVFNYRLSRARRVVENAFGVLALRYRCLLTTLAVGTETATDIIEACLTLHNIFRIRNPTLQNIGMDAEDDHYQLVPGAWRTDAVMQEVEDEGRGPRATADGKRLRAYFREYFNCDAGSVPWQLRAVNFEQ